MKVKDEIQKNLILVFSILLLIFYISCEDFKSQEYQISDQDALACQQLSDTVFNTISLKSLTDFNSSWVDSNVTGNVSEILDSLEANDIVFIADGSESTLISTTAADTNYFAMRSDFSSIVCYSTESITMNLLAENDQIKRTSDLTMPLELVSGCTVMVNEKPVPLVLARMKYGFSDDRYLVQFIKDDQTRSNSIKISVLRNQ